jgi:uncharacterized membrane protein required for colicin V production
MSTSLGTHLLVAALAAALLLGLYHGLRGGLVRSAFKLLGFIAGLLLARPLAAALAPRLPAEFDFPGSGVVLVLLCFVAIAMVFALVGYLLAKSVSWTPLVWLDRAGGGLLGLAIGLILAGLLLGMLDRLGVAAPLINGATGWEASFLRFLIGVTNDLFGAVGRLGGAGHVPPGAV